MRRFNITILIFASFAACIHADEYDTLRAKWKNIIVGTGYDTLDPDVASKLVSIANSANNNWSSMDKSPTRTFLWSDNASTTISSHITNTYNRLLAMAQAYATPGCSLFGDAALLADIVSGLDWMHANRYGASTAQYDNWWDWEIGSPLRLTDICVLLYDQLTTTQLTNYMNAVNLQTPTPDMTQANKVWKARVVGVRGCLVKNAAKLVLCRDAFSAVFPYVTTGDGYYTDGSFIQHDYHPYTAGYGASLIQTMAPIMNWLSGSTWAITDPAQANLYRWVFDSYEPIIYRGNVFDLVRGREAGRSGATPSGHSMMDSILQIAQFAPTAEALRMKRMIKEWAQQDYTRNFVTGRGLPTLELAQSLMNDSSITARGELTAHYTFAEMDRVIHLGPGYGFGLTMCSTRIANFESINGENLRGWFTGDGQTTLYNGDLNAFSDSYWATVDHYRLPGVTADVTHVKTPSVPASIGPRAQGQTTLSPHSWVGGATLGKYGAAGMQFKGVAVTLTGKKSWFMFDDEIVCLGAGITSTDSRPIETTVEQRKLSTAGNNAFTVNGTAKPSTLGWTEAMSSTSWAHLAGNVTGSDIGYYFPTAPVIKAVREARTGAWSDIDSDGSTTPITRNYLRMTFEHGSNPTSSTYQYVLLPGRSATRTGHYAAAPHITVINNNANVQAVRENTLGITAANFWTDSTFTYGGITSNKKASVLVREDGPFIDVCVSDPTQLNTAGITLQIALDGGTLVSADAGVTVTQSTPSIAMTVATTGSAGKTFKARFYKLTPDIVNLAPVADSYVYDATASVNTNFGTAINFAVKKAGTGFNRESYLRFDLPTSSGVLLGGSLKLYALTASTPGVHAVVKVDDNTWSETGITWNNKPAAGSILSTWTPVLNTFSSGNVSSALPVSGLVSFKVYATTETADGFVSYASRQNSTVANRPQLTLSYGHTPPEVSITSPADGAVINRAGTVTISADAIATDGAITSVAFYDGTTLMSTDSAAPYSITPTLTGGPHYLKAIATDANGLTRSSLITRVDVAYPPVANASALNTPRATAIDINLRNLVSDVETPLTSLKLQLGSASNGTVTMLPDGNTARFTPSAAYSGPASFTYTVTDTTRDDRTLLNYAFQNNDSTDSSGQNRDATLNLQGTGAASYVSSSPLADYTQSLTLTENSTAGAARIERSLLTSEVDLATEDWTLAGWFKRSTATNQDVILQLGSSGSFGPSALTLGFYGTGSTLELRNYTSANTQDIGLSKTSVTTGTWNHFAIIRSGSVMSWYHNGTLVGSDSAFALAFTNSQPVKFGGSGATNVLDRWLNGSLADLAIFNAALAPSDVTKISSVPVQWLGGQNASATISITVLSAVENWRQQNFGTITNTGDFADTADKDKDGLANLLEYACATNPNTSSPAPASSVRNGNNLEYTYTKNKAATDVTFTVEWSDDLLTWSTTSVTSNVLSDNGTTQQIKATMPAGTNGRRFVHLKVTRP
jgi:hyaluronate lyase